MGVLKDFDCNTVKNEKTVVATDNDFRIVRSGLSYSGVCKNDQCTAKGQGVVCNRGHGTFVVNDDIMSGLVKCPKCGHDFEMQAVNLYQCDAVVKVLDHTEEVQTYKPRHDDIVKLGSRKTLTIQPQALLCIDVRQPKQCAVM
ncbi:hypothetical protein DIPPA_15547 [Diplonema papillatum]|nr:hypothetical protein DIPPA_15547 [Diplonema papillatum]